MKQDEKRSEIAEKQRVWPPKPTVEEPEEAHSEHRRSNAWLYLIIITAVFISFSLVADIVRLIINQNTSSYAWLRLISPELFLAKVLVSFLCGLFVWLLHVVLAPKLQLWLFKLISSRGTPRR